MYLTDRAYDRYDYIHIVLHESSFVDKPWLVASYYFWSITLTIIGFGNNRTPSSDAQQRTVSRSFSAVRVSTSSLTCNPNMNFPKCLKSLWVVFIVALMIRWISKFSYRGAAVPKSLLATRGYHSHWLADASQVNKPNGSRWGYSMLYRKQRGNINRDCAKKRTRSLA